MNKVLFFAICVLASAQVYALTPVSPEFACGRLSSDSLKLSCFAAIYGKQVSSMGAAACDRMNDSYDTLNCMTIVASGYVNDAAVEACDRISDATQKNPCLAAIVNKSYTAGEVSICDGMTTAQATTACFQQFGTSVYTRPVYPTYPTYPTRPTYPTYSPASEKCYVKQTNELLDRESFFSRVSQWSQRHNQCAVAKIATVASSGRIYNIHGSRVGTGLSNSETDLALSALGWYGCQRFTCEQQ